MGEAWQSIVNQTERLERTSEFLFIVLNFSIKSISVGNSEIQCNMLK